MNRPAQRESQAPNTPTPTRTTPEPQTAASRPGQTREATTGVCSGGCEARIAGTSGAHCTVCHETFGSVRGFDRHRSNGTCLDPAGIGMERLDRGGWTRWITPMDDAARAHFEALNARKDGTR